MAVSRECSRDRSVAEGLPSNPVGPWLATAQSRWPPFGAGVRQVIAELVRLFEMRRTIYDRNLALQCFLGRRSLDLVVSVPSEG